MNRARLVCRAIAPLILTLGIPAGSALMLEAAKQKPAPEPYVQIHVPERNPKAGETRKVETRVAESPAKPVRHVHPKMPERPMGFVPEGKDSNYFRPVGVMAPDSFDFGEQASKRNRRTR